jgi:hypothetical protein
MYIACASDAEAIAICTGQLRWHVQHVHWQVSLSAVHMITLRTLLN